jgi:hypothetical protein
MITSSQTTADLTSIIETLDQRIHELNSQPSAGTDEVGPLDALRAQAVSLVSAA